MNTIHLSKIEKDLLSSLKNRSDYKDYLLQLLSSLIEEEDSHNSEHIVYLKVIYNKIATSELIDYNLDDVEIENPTINGEVD